MSKRHLNKPNSTQFNGSVGAGATKVPEPAPISKLGSMEAMDEGDGSPRPNFLYVRRGETGYTEHGGMYKKIEDGKWYAWSVDEDVFVGVFETEKGAAAAAEAWSKPYWCHRHQEWYTRRMCDGCGNLDTVCEFDEGDDVCHTCCL